MKESDGCELFTTEDRHTLCPTNSSFIGSSSNRPLSPVLSAVSMLSKSQPCRGQGGYNSDRFQKRANGWTIPAWHFPPPLRQISTLMAFPSHSSRFPQSEPDTT
ncbi:hypothetical protein F7725_015259 [Dissostichus mawsoni]|uniref:Uncharacterized protein n=1 Tax=Dissostichus mawsoni TaxID=36200 RepID=A0A7J5YGY8_DISMA|nr:hypothetical protein F7725_015259 [Dissostichus mawsoni]